MTPDKWYEAAMALTGHDPHQEAQACMKNADKRALLNALTAGIEMSVVRDGHMVLDQALLFAFAVGRLDAMLDGDEASRRAEAAVQAALRG